MTEKKFKAVLAFIKHPTDPNLFLGVSRKNNPSDFGLPGGKQEDRETVRDALSRELLEETGLHIKSMKPLFRRFNKDKDLKFSVSTFSVEVDSYDISTTEAGIVSWVTREVLEAGTFGSYNKALFDSI